MAWVQDALPDVHRLRDERLCKLEHVGVEGRAGERVQSGGNVEENELPLSAEDGVLCE